jgi:hypothetical protein
MSTSRFNYSFYQDGREDLLAEVRLLQSCGQWTKEKRKSVLKDAISTYQRIKHTHPRIPEACAYYAGRVSIMKSALTMNFSSKETVNLIVYRPLAPHTDRFCGLFDCGNEALWGLSIQGDPQPFALLCDECRQEWVRERSAYVIPSGWDWDEHEDLPLPLLQPRREKLGVSSDRAEPQYIFFPCTAIIGLGFLDMTLQIPILIFILQALFILHLTVWGKSILKRFFLWIESEL